MKVRLIIGMLLTSCILSLTYLYGKESSFASLDASEVAKKYSDLFQSIGADEIYLDICKQKRRECVNRARWKGGEHEFGYYAMNDYIFEKTKIVKTKEGWIVYLPEMVKDTSKEITIRKFTELMERFKKTYERDEKIEDSWS